jgi:hypothetical protein
MNTILSRLALLLSAALLAASPLAAQSASLAGTVLDDAGRPLNGMTVAAYNSAGEQASLLATGLDGRFTMSLPAATYRVLAYDPQGTWATSFYDEASSFETSGEIRLAAGESRTGINIRMQPALRVHGVVMGPTGPLAGMVVSAYNLDGTRRGFQTSGPLGEYVLALPKGQYKMVAWDDALAYGPQFYANVRSFAEASTISVTSNVFQVDFSLQVGARVSGTAIAEGTGQALGGIEIAAYDAERGDRVAYVTSRSNGEFAFALPPGRYKFGAADPAGKYAAKFFSNAPSFAAAASFQLVAGGAQRLDFALAAKSEPPSPTTLFIPAVINSGGGEGSYWRTDVWIYNPSQEPLTIEAAYLAGAAASESSIAVSPRGQVEISNILQTLFGTSGIGSLRLTAPQPFVAVSRTFTTSGAGTFGFSIAGMETSASLGLAVLPGLAHGSAYRTNIGIMNPHEHGITVRARLYSAGGGLVAESSVPIAPLTVLQPRVEDLFGAIQFAEGYVVLGSADGSFFSYASIVDNKSNDPTLVLPAADREE